MNYSVQDMLQSVLDKAVADADVAGASVLVMQHGQERWYAQSGLRSIERNEPITRDTIFRLYSQSKPITGAAVMLLVERGIIDLVEPVSAYLPGFVGQVVHLDRNDTLSSGVPMQKNDDTGVAAGNADAIVEEPVQRAMTIKDLLTMTSGLVYPDATFEAGRITAKLFDELGDRLYSDNPMGTVEFANRLGQLPLRFHPGSHWSYGTSADVLGAVVEVASGMRFGDFLQQEFFGPLGMTDTSFFVPADKQHRLVAAYDNPKDPVNAVNRGHVLREIRTDHLGIPYAADHAPAFESGGAGLRSTLDDYAKFGQMLINGGELNGVRIFQPDTVRMMTTNGLKESQRRDFSDWMPAHGYNALMDVAIEPGLADENCHLGEYGWGGWLGSYFCNDPTTGTTFLVMMQLTNSGTLPFIRKMKNIVWSHVS